MDSLGWLWYSLEMWCAIQNHKEPYATTHSEEFMDTEGPEGVDYYCDIIMQRAYNA